MKFCPTCKYYLYLKSSGANAAGETVEADSTQTEQSLTRHCINCGYREIDEKGGLISETLVQQKSSEAFKIMINEFTRQDNTLPHIKMIPCPKESCPSNIGDKERDVIYMTYDAPGKKNLYICNVCGEQWKSRN
jgi:DNA-directed RNA polymerase subunit M/transcription elongation factor TFIIS